MYGAELFDFSLWWVFPLIMVVLCFLMMRRGGGSTMCGFGARGAEGSAAHTRESSRSILERRYAKGEIDRAEYEEKSRVLAGEQGTGKE